MIPFLGAGASLVERPADVNWQQGGYLPSGSELADYFAKSYQFPETGPLDLVRVSQYVDLAAGHATLYEELHSIFAGRYEPNKLHRLVANFPVALRAAESTGRTARDHDQLRRLAGARLRRPPTSRSTSSATPPSRRAGHASCTCGPMANAVAIAKHTDYHGFDLAERSVILKIHGAVDRQDEARDSYVITEDDYIDYLARGTSRDRPAYLMARMRTSHFLFLGYGMRDWNLRVILRHIWAEQPRRSLRGRSSSTRARSTSASGQRHGVEIIDVKLEDWVDGCEGALQ